MGERKLATIRKVSEIIPIPDADKIECVQIDGWRCVVKKSDNIKVGDLVCYIEIDSIVPSCEFFEFMKERHFRVRTIKLKKQISQGLVINFDNFKECTKQLETYDIALGCWKEGEDVSDILNIVKYIPPDERESEVEGTSKKKHSAFVKFMTRFEWYRKLFKKKSKSFPEWLSVTDEERIQNIPWILKNKNIMYVSEKLDGQSVSYWYRKFNWFKDEFGICSRTVRKFEWDNSNWSKTAKKFDIKNKLKSLKRNIALQGEIIGPKIQENKYKVDDFNLYIFNVYDIDKKRYLDFLEAKNLVTFIGLKFVPILNNDYILPDSTDEIVEFSKGKSKIYDTLREGIVVRSYDKKVSFKVINPEFLLKYKI